MTPVPRGFALAGKDGTSHPAAVQLQANNATLWAVAVREPVAAHYAWDPDTAANRVNAAGLPASTFQVRVGP